MRKIKYKAWSKEFGDFLNINMFECIDGEIIGIYHDGNYIGYDKDDITLLEYTGLHDKNGKEIYEGHIVYYKSKIQQFEDWLTHEQIGEVKIDKGMTCFIGKTKQTYKDVVNIHDSKFLLLSSDIYEVIGNICQNPELLE